MTDPVSDTEPMTAPSRVAIMGMAGSRSAPGPASEVAVRNSDRATTAAAPPPAPLKIATICGIAVIGTRRAPTTPMTVPISPPTTSTHQLFSRPSVVAMVQATTRIIPAAPSRFPVRAVLGDARNFRARMKVTAPTR